MSNQTALVELNDASLALGGHALWDNLHISLQAGEFLGVLGPNGSGKSSLLKVILGLQKLDTGSVQVRAEIGYIPQQRTFDPEAPVRGRDVVRFGVDGNQWGLRPLNTAAKSQIDQAIALVGAKTYADAPMGKLSGGQQQRLRIAQALVSNPRVLLCDEPLLSLDMASQKAVAELIQKRREQGAAVVFVTHEINPILPYVDRILYLVGGKWKLGTPDEVLTSGALSHLYGTSVDVIKIRDRILVVAGDEGVPTEPANPHHHVHHEGHD